LRFYRRWYFQLLGFWLLMVAFLSPWSIRIHADFIQKQADEIFEEERRKYLERIQNEP